MKTTNNYEAPVAEMIEMATPVVLAYSGGGQNTGNDPNSGQPGTSTWP